MGRRRRTTLGRALAATLAACVWNACGGDGPEPLSTVLITLDTTRADALSCYGEHAGVTPSLDALASESLLYEGAYSVAPLTLPAHSSMLTGLYPIRHGVRDNGVWPLPDSALTECEAESEAEGLSCMAVLRPFFIHRRCRSVGCELEQFHSKVNWRRML